MSVQYRSLKSFFVRTMYVSLCLLVTVAWYMACFIRQLAFHGRASLGFRSIFVVFIYLEKRQLCMNIIYFIVKVIFRSLAN